MDEIVKAVLTNGVTPVAIIILVAFGFVIAVMKRWIVLGFTYDEKAEESRIWRQIALQNGSQAQKLLDNKDLGVALLESIVKETTPEGKS
jgi:lysylphosphatidylglycerol synthetase-like protein (DUF2156 family)